MKEQVPRSILIRCTVNFVAQHVNVMLTAAEEASYETQETILMQFQHRNVFLIAVRTFPAPLPRRREAEWLWCSVLLSEGFIASAMLSVSVFWVNCTYSFPSLPEAVWQWKAGLLQVQQASSCWKLGVCRNELLGSILILFRFYFWMTTCILVTPRHCSTRRVIHVT